MTDFWEELDEEWNDGAKKEAEEEAKKGAASLLPEGTYNLKVKDWTFMRSKNKDTPGLNMEFVVANGTHEGRVVWHTFWLTKGNLAYVGRDLNYLTGRMFTKFSDLKTYDFKGLYVTAKVKHEEYQGKEQVKVSYFSVLSGKETKPDAAPAPATAASSVTKNADDPF